MTKNTESLTEILRCRLEASGTSALRLISRASEVVVFGSMAVGLDNPNSDIDVLCIGGNEFKLKTTMLDLIVTPIESTESSPWLGGELASHVSEYGIWIKGTPARWKSRVHIGPKAIAEKNRRVSAFMTALPKSWHKLEECFRVKYATKLRRETQRLLLLERGVPVPPTRILDYSWNSVSLPMDEVQRRLQQLSFDPHDAFVTDLLARLNAYFRTAPLAS